MSLKNFTFAQICQMIIVPAFFDTLKMLLISGILSTVFGFVFGVILIITEKGGLYENIVVNRRRFTERFRGIGDAIREHCGEQAA